MLRGLAGYKPEEAKPDNIEQKIRAEVVGKIAQGLMKLAGGNGDGIIELAMSAPVATAAVATDATTPATTASQTSSDYMAPWLETENCTACDECTKLNPKIFAYNKDKKAYIMNPEGGPYSDLVKAAERCTARVIHPGLPKDRSEKDIDKWIKRGEKFN
jgi:pyruvate-ferredoxin/flavodoxin oxidoreductase